jgi:hypothetical protein
MAVYEEWEKLGSLSSLGKGLERLLVGLAESDDWHSEGERLALHWNPTWHHPGPDGSNYRQQL